MDEDLNKYREKLEDEFEIVNLVQTSKIIEGVLIDRGKERKPSVIDKYSTTPNEGLKVLIEAGNEKGAEYINQVIQQKQEREKK